MNELEIFKSAEFGDIRTMIVDNEPWFVGKDLTKCLGYSNASKALADHVDTEDKLNNESVCMEDSIDCKIGIFRQKVMLLCFINIPTNRCCRSPFTFG